MQQSRPPRPKRPGTLMPVAECINLDTLAQRAHVLEMLDGKLRHHLPDALARECRLADVRNGRLVFLASSPTWATRLRLHQATLLKEARVACGNTVDLVVVKVAAPSPVPPEPTRPKPLSAAAARHLRSAAKTLKDPELKALYQHLASIAEEKNPPET
jgi:hypothetical protein